MYRWWTWTIRVMDFPLMDPLPAVLLFFVFVPLPLVLLVAVLFRDNRGLGKQLRERRHRTVLARLLCNHLQVRVSHKLRFFALFVV